MESKFKTLNEIELKLTNNGKTLVEETCCTAITILMTNEGDINTSFVGAYNPEIIKILSKVQRTYFKNLIKRLKANNKAEANNIINHTDEPVEQTQEVEEKKQKKVHENSRKKPVEKQADSETKADTKTDNTNDNKTNTTKATTKKTTKTDSTPKKATKSKTTK